ncbi:uncharacterized protein LOC130234428 [Danio aesculapii]|uniref:uncharacterized protein LOC130234428 n=1 Tax=Danio aesculapii TaxID=1142201 RepID=UPI0024C079C8|nr:uncharacterized protein LOC130234428 [Danio aesculapii]
MEVFQTRVPQLNMCVIVTLLTYLDYSISNQEAKIKQHISKTVFVGNTVTLHCNKTTLDDDFTWGMNNSAIFRQFSNRTQTNFSSNRIHIDPVAPRELKIQQIQASDAGNYTCYPAGIRWILTTENQPRPDVPQENAYIIIIIVASSGVTIVCLITTIYICKHRRCKNNIESEQQDHRETSQAPSRGRIQTQRSQYFERYNSVYGQI